MFSYRLNPDLGEFVSTIYSRAFKPQKVQARQLAAALKSISQDLGMDFGIPSEIMDAVQWFLLALSDVMLRSSQTILTPPAILASTPARKKRMSGTSAEGAEIDTAPHPVSLALIRLQTVSPTRSEGVGYEVHVRAEAAVAAALVTSLQRCSPNDDIFVATPHRIQRQAVKAALGMVRMDDEGLAGAMEGLHIEAEESDELEVGRKGKVTVDTVERLQGVYFGSR